MTISVAEPDRAIKPPHRGARSAALDLVCACLAPGTRVLPDAAAVDPALLARVARRHQVSALVAARLSEAGVPVPEPLRSQAERARHRALRQLGFTLDLVDALASRGVPAVPVKGVVLSQQVFGSPLLRGAVDVDMLVRPGDVGTAWEVLARVGFRQITPSSRIGGARLALFCRAAKDSLHRHPESGQVVELHWRLSDEMAEPSMPPEDSLATVVPAPGRPVRVLGEEVLFVYLCTHGAAHGWARLKWLADVAALLHGSTDGGTVLWAAACRAGAGVAAGSAILLAQELFGLAPPPGFVPPRGLRIAAVLWIARRIIRAGEGARELETTPWRGWAEMLAKLLVAAGWRARLAVFRRLALAGEDIAQVPLPRGLFWLYPVLRVPLLVRRRTMRWRQLRRGGGVGNTA
ncbi:nucleotidyltransferase family protein [Erythrobacter colymbi]|uniref:nucleotidyltransferase domain-containing protein n=1 Tax=Erythrobacter colymbi TaxID=1161202 RepID=UPI000A372131|nr:nucleotidyltransferase family protein [Erythrobacter colymbi]